MFRSRRQERRESRSFERDAGNKRYVLRQRMFSIGEDYYVEDDRGERVFKVDGKALRLRKTLYFEDMTGRRLAKLQERLLRVKDSMEIEDPDGRRLAMVKKALVTPVRERWTVHIEDGPDLDVQGNILDHEYTFWAGRDKAAEVSKKWFRLRDTYGVEIAPGYHDVVILAAAVAVDAMAHQGR